MKFSYDMLFEYVSQTWPVLDACRSAGDASFSYVRLMDRSGRNAFDPETLYVTEEDALLEFDAETTLPGIMCICGTKAPAGDRARNSSWIVIGAPSLAVLLNQLLDHFFTLQMWEESMEQLIAHDGSMVELLDMSEPILSLPVAVCGPLFNSFQYTSNIKSDDSFFVEIEQNGCLSPESVALLEQSGVFGTPVEDRNVKVFSPSGALKTWHMNRHFRENGERVFFVTAMCPDGKPKQGTIELFDILASKLYKLYRKKQAAEGSGLGAQELALRELLTNEEINREQIEDAFKKAGIKVGGIWQLAVLEFQDPDAIHKAYQANFFRERFREALTCVFDGRIVVLCTSNYLNGKLTNELRALARRQSGAVGLSSKFTNVAETPAAHRQASFAIRMGTHISDEQVLKRQLGIDKSYPNACFKFDDYLLHELLDHYPLGTRGLNPGRRPAFALVDYDKANGTQKTRFLHTYLECNCSVNDTARVLGIHRNSVGYQVRSIESLLGVDIHDIDFICHTRIAFASMEVFGL